jgi:hypothetical protein
MGRSLNCSQVDVGMGPHVLLYAAAAGMVAGLKMWSDFEVLVENWGAEKV